MLDTISIVTVDYWLSTIYGGLSTETLSCHRMLGLLFEGSVTYGEINGYSHYHANSSVGFFVWFVYFCIISKLCFNLYYQCLLPKHCLAHCCSSTIFWIKYISKISLFKSQGQGSLNMILYKIFFLIKEKCSIFLFETLKNLIKYNLPQFTSLLEAINQ